MSANTDVLAAEISLRIAALLTGKSIKTIQRWCDERKLYSRVVDFRGKRVTTVGSILPFTDILPADAGLIVHADSGDAAAQNEIGVILLEAGKPHIALDWFRAAAARDHADAMHWLSKYYLCGTMGVEQNQDIAMKWLAAAAAHGHIIAKAQLRALPLTSSPP
jgi:TPR repeat protein